MTKYRMIPYIFLTLLSFFVLIMSPRLGLGSFHNPGPGFVPFLLGLALLMTSLYPIAMFFLTKKAAAEHPKKAQKSVDYKKMGYVLLALIGYTLALEGLGFVATTSIFLLIIFRGMGNKWITVFIGAAITAAATYFLFTSLGVRFPDGIWW